MEIVYPKLHLQIQNDIKYNTINLMQDYKLTNYHTMWEWNSNHPIYTLYTGSFIGGAYHSIYFNVETDEYMYGYPDMDGDIEQYEYVTKNWNLMYDFVAKSVNDLLNDVNSYLLNK